MGKRLVFCSAMLFLLLSLPSWAQEDPCGPVFDAQIQTLTNVGGLNAFLRGENSPTGCILGTADTTGVEGLYRPLFDKETPRAEQVAIRARLFAAVDEHLSEGTAITCSQGNQYACLADRQLEKLTALERALLNGINDDNRNLADLNMWQVTSRGQIRISQIDLPGYLGNICTAGIDSAECKRGVMNAAKLVRSAGAGYQLIVAYNLPSIEHNSRFLTQSDREWSAYFNEVSVQYPWEMLWNGKVYQDKNEASLANFPRAPSSKRILAHPSVGFEYIDTPTGDSGLEAAVLLEIIGYERWSWSGGHASNRWGGSIVASFADIAGMDSVGWGLVVHTPIRNLSIGAVRRGGNAGNETAIFLNADLAALFMKYKDADVDKFLKGKTSN